MLFMIVTKNDRNFTFLIVIQFIFLLLAIAFDLVFDPLISFLAVCLIVAARFWSQFFKNAYEIKHTIAQSICDFTICLTLLVYACVVGYVSLALCLTCILFFCAFLVLYCLFFNSFQSEIVKAIDACCYVFLFIGLAFVYLNYATTLEFGKICLISCIITAVISIIYKIAYVIKYKIPKKSNKSKRAYSYKKKK